MVDGTAHQHWYVVIHGDVSTWLIAIGTIALAAATIFLAVAAWKALGQLEEARTDRHVQVMAEFGRRWNSEMMVRALVLESRYSPAELAQVVCLARTGRSRNPIRERRRRRAQAEFRILLRIPDFFEDLAFMAKFANLGDEALATFKGLVLDEWPVWETAVYEMRAGGDKFSYTQFEALVERMASVPDL